MDKPICLPCSLKTLQHLYNGILDTALAQLTRLLEAVNHLVNLKLLKADV